MHLVDTNVVSELARQKPDLRVLEWFARQRSFALSTVTIEELAFGIARSPGARRAKLGAWMDAMISTSELYDVTAPIARAAGELRASRETRGRRVTQADMLIAATAVVHGLVVATRNLDDFAGCGVTLVNPFVA